MLELRKKSSNPCSQVQRSTGIVMHITSGTEVPYIAALRSRFVDDRDYQMGGCAMENQL